MVDNELEIIKIKTGLSSYSICKKTIIIPISVKWMLKGFSHAT